MLLIHFIFRLCEIFFLSNQRTKNGDFASIILEIFLKFEAEKSKLSDFAFFFPATPLQTSGHSVLSA